MTPEKGKNELTLSQLLPGSTHTFVVIAKNVSMKLIDTLQGLNIEMVSVITKKLF